ncbi:MAG: transposase [Deltaproteobacteria bacterium]|nr:transposase [Deltaproteobacteria bacterium]
MIDVLDFDNYALNQKEALYHYLDNGWLKPDNNTAENAIRPLALGRKNWLPARPACRPQSGRRWPSGGFASSERGGKAAALYYFLIESCKACDVNPCLSTEPGRGVSQYGLIVPG